MKDIFYFADSFVYFPNTSLWGESCLSAPADRLGDEWDIDIAKRCRTFSGRAARMSTERLLGTYASLMAVGMSIFLQRKIQTGALLSHLNTVHPQPQKQQKTWNFANKTLHIFLSILSNSWSKRLCFLSSRRLLSYFLILLFQMHQNIWRRRRVDTFSTERMLQLSPPPLIWCLINKRDVYILLSWTFIYLLRGSNRASWTTKGLFDESEQS